MKHSQLSLFADDATLCNSAASLESIKRPIASDIDNVNNWCRENGMIIKENKSKCMVIGTTQRIARLPSRTLSIDVNGTALDDVDVEKLLGVHIDPHLNSYKHVDYVCRSIMSKLVSLKRIKRFLPLNYRKLCVLKYNAYILPCIDYYLSIWGNTAKQIWKESTNSRTPFHQRA